MKDYSYYLQRTKESALARNAGWLAAGQGTGFVLQAMYFIIVARLLGVEQYGVFGGAFAFTGLVAQFSTLGTGTVFMRHVSGKQKLFAVYWGNVLFVTLVVGGSLTVALHFFGGRLLNPQSAALVLVAAIANCFCAQLTLECARVFQSFEQMRITATLNLITNLVRTIAAGLMLLILHHATAWQWSLVALTVSAFATIMGVSTVTVRYGFPRFEARLFLKHGMEGFGYTFATSTSMANNDLDKAMLSHYGMNFANGVYSMAYRVVDLATTPLLSIREAVLPRLFRVGGSGVEEPAILSLRILKYALPIGLLAGVVTFVSAPLIPYILGNGFAESAIALRWLCLLPVFRSVHYMTGTALTGAGHQTTRTAALLGAALLNFGLNMWLIPHFGWRGAAWSSLVTDGVLGIACWFLLGAMRAIGRQQKLEKVG